MGTRIGINGFGRMGRLALRAGWGDPEIEFVHVNEPEADLQTMAHLLTFDSVHGRWENGIGAADDGLTVGGSTLTHSCERLPAQIGWADLGVRVVLECSGRFRTPESLDGHFAGGAQKVVVSAPVKQGALNIVLGVNDHLYESESDRIVTAASCTTNCLAPVVKVIDQGIGISRGSITTLHDLTNTQNVIDAPHNDLRRARAAGLSLIPTSTGSAAAIGMIFPHLEGRLDGLAVRVPLLNASLTDCVFELERPSSPGEVNELLESAAAGPLAGILGYEERPLVSVDFRGDRRSSVIDSLSTRVTDRTQAKILAWYDNEWGYANRLAELAAMVARSLPDR
jgi:glyceraldehyde 3-phosphate dehydrogenase